MLWVLILCLIPCKTARYDLGWCASVPRISLAFSCHKCCPGLWSLLVYLALINNARNCFLFSSKNSSPKTVRFQYMCPVCQNRLSGQSCGEVLSSYVNHIISMVQGIERSRNTVHRWVIRNWSDQRHGPKQPVMT